MKMCLYLLAILALLLQPVLSFLPAASAQEGSGDPLAPDFPINYVRLVPTGTGNCSSWDNACDLQTALGVALAGDEIWVQQGTYKPNSWENLTDFTFVAWVYWRGGGNWQRIFDFGADTNNFLMLSPRGSDGVMHFQIRVAGTIQNLSTTIALPQNSWQHVAVTLTGDTATIFVNGNTLASSSTITFDPYQVINSDKLYLGKSLQSSDPYLNGIIDEVALFNRALSQPEISTIYSNGWDATPGKVLALHLEENPASDGSWLLDSFNNGFGGRLFTNNLTTNKSDTGPVGYGQALSLDGNGDYVTLMRRQGAFNLKSGVAVYGGFAGWETSLGQRQWPTNTTTLSGDIGVAGTVGDNSLHVVYGNGLDANTVLDGFTISGGNANISGVPQEWGGGMYLLNSNLAIRNMVFQSNSARGGGGMFIDGGAPLLENVDFVGNTGTTNGGGLHTYNGASPTLTAVDFINNSANSSGGGMYTFGDSPTLTNVTFINNSATYHGGGMYNNDSSATLANVTFNGNSAYNNAGGMYNKDSSATLANVTFNGNSAYNGGGMSNWDSNLSLDNVTFTQNIVSCGNAGCSPNGAGMYNIRSNPVMTGGGFTGNSASCSAGSCIATGGGMHNDSMNSTLSGVTFIDNSASCTGNDCQAHGGGIYNTNSNPTLTGGSFSANTSSQSGGGMYNSGSSPSLTGVGFDNNGAQNGGGMYNSSSSPTLIDVTISDHSVSGSGGGMYNTTNSNPTLAGVTFVDNNALMGGGMYNEHSSPSLNGVNFYNNLSPNGGGMYNSYSSPSLSGGVFAGNIAGDITPGICNGGGIYNLNSNPTLTGMTFRMNHARNEGGGIYNTNSSPPITETLFIDNTASSGGGMYTTSGSPSLVLVTFSGNDASVTGGGMYNQNSSPQITQTFFYTNTAVTAGGGLFNLTCTTQAHPVLANVLFNANQVTGTNGQGGGIYNDNCPAELTNVTIAHNHAGLYGGGIYATGTFSPTLHNSLLWDNTASGTTADNQYHLYPPFMVFNTTIQQSASDPSPFVDAVGLDGIPGTRDDDLHPTYPSAYEHGSVIDGGVENNLPADTHDLDGDGITSAEKLPVDLDGHPRIYADNDLDGVCDLVTTLEMDEWNQVDRGAYEAGCWAWHMQKGNEKLVEGRDYRLGFHAEIDDPSTVTIGQTLLEYATERSLGNLAKARQSYEIALDCATTVTQTHQATRGILDVIWEQATGAMLEGNEQMVQILDVTGNGASDNELSQLIQARDLYDEAVRGYLEPIASGDYPGLLETLAISRTNPITYTTETSLVDLERLLKASAGKSRAALELAERQLRKGQEPQAEQTLRQGIFQAQAEMALLYSLWPEASETEDYTGLLRNIGDMDRLYGYMVSGKNPLGYDPDFIPFSYDYEHPTVNNYLQSWYIAGRDLDAAETAVTAAAGKQQEVDDDYEAMQVRLSDVRRYYNGILVDLCGATPGDLPDREHCARGDIQEQEEVVENAMLQVERVLLQMDNQNALIRIEQERVAAEAGIRYATARMITANGEQLADLADQEANLRFSKSTAQGILGIVQGFISGGLSAGGGGGGGSGGPLSIGGFIAGGVLGAVTAGLDWKFQADVASDIGDVTAKKERLYAAQQAAVEYAEGDIANANSLALQRQYMLKFAELDIDLAIAMNNLEKELAHLVNLRNQAEYALAEQAKAQAFTSLLYRDPAGRVVREHYMELAHYRYERALDSGFKAGKALAYEINEDVTYTGLPLTRLDAIFPLQDVNLLSGAMQQMDDAYTDWLSVVHAPDEDTYNYVYLSLAVGFDTDPSSTREEKFNAFIRDPAQRVDRDGDGCPEVEFSFQTSIQTGNKLGLYTTVFNDKIKLLQMRVYGGTDLFYGDERQSIAGIRLKQAGTSMLRTRYSQIPTGGEDDLGFYNLDPWNIIMQAAVNDNPLPSASTGLASRSVAATEWTINIEGGAGSACGDLNLDHIEDIRLYITHEYYPLQTRRTGAASTELAEGPPVREYRPIQRTLPSQALVSPLAQAGSLSPAAPSADNDLNGLFVGTLVITQPLYLPPVELSVQLTDLAGSLTGYISPTLTFPVVPGTGHGPVLNGAWSGSGFSLAAQPFVTDLIQGIPITRTLQFEDGLITSTEITRTLSGAYIEILEGLTPEPLEMRGVFRLERPLRPLQAGFGASPRSVYVGDNVFFSDGSLGNPVSWSWTFGDGGTSTLQNPVHTYAAPGEYTVSLTVNDGFGTHMHTETEYISVMSPSAEPHASFTANPLGGPVPLEVSFQDHSYGGPTSWLWNFGDGSTSTQRNPTHIYTQVGVFSVSLTVTNLFGSDTYTWNNVITTEMRRLLLPIIRRN